MYLESAAWTPRRLACVSGMALLLVGCGDDGPTGPPDGGDQAGVVSYSVVFEASWSAQTHPTAFPPGPHFSGLIGATHGPDVTFWAAGSPASPGIKSMAETGSKQPLTSEVESAIATGSAESVLSGGGISRSPGTVSLSFTVSQQHSRVTLVSMIAPSPDWFVGVAGLDLYESGAWADEVVVELLPYDAGTDSGATYTSANAATSPPMDIARITDAPFADSVPLGTFRFTRTGSG